jgi:hypothetical protein
MVQQNNNIGAAMRRSFMIEVHTNSHSVKIIRWIARIWSVLFIAGSLLIFFSPDSLNAGPIPTVDKFLLNLIGLAFLGLLIAWRWELVGGIFAIAMLFMREIVWVILKGHWLLGFLILWILIAPPAILFLMVWRLERKAKKLE